jgi:hypothetical protein
MIGVANYWLGTTQGHIRWGIRAAFLSIIGGLFFYTYLATEMPGSESIIQNSGLGGIIMMTLMGAAIGAGIVWIWRILYRKV